MEKNNMIADKSNTKEFIQSSIEHATQMIIFTDTKIGVLFVLYGFVVAGIIEFYDSILKTAQLIFSYGVCQFVLFVVIMIILIISIFSSIFFAIKTIFPITNPANAVPHKKFVNEDAWYILLDKNKSKVTYTLEQYSKMICSKNDDFFIKCLSFELLKLSYIRNKKNDCFKKSFTAFSIFIVSAVIVAIIIFCVNIF